MKETVKIWIRCPGCGREFKSLVVKTARCRYCGRSITVFPKRSASPIVKVEGDMNEFFRLRRNL